MFELPKLPYAYNALEPYLDAATMEIHHTKHHQTYTDKLNAALAGQDALADMNAEELLKNLDVIPESIRSAVRNHGGGFMNHQLFWQMMSPQFDQSPSGLLLDAMQTKFSTFESFQEKFTAQALAVFGSGWTWLVAKNGELDIVNTPNQDSPLSVGAKPLLGIDLWEHAYYLKFQNRRPEYVTAWWHVVNWSYVNELFAKTK